MFIMKFLFVFDRIIFYLKTPKKKNTKEKTNRKTKQKLKNPKKQNINKNYG